MPYDKKGGLLGAVNFVSETFNVRDVLLLYELLFKEVSKSPPNHEVIATAVTFMTDIPYC